MYQYLLCQDTHNNYNKTQCAKLLEKHTDWFPSIPVSQIDTSFKEANYEDANRTIEALIYCARDLEAWEKTPGELDGSERFPRGNQDLVKVYKYQVLYFNLSFILFIFVQMGRVCCGRADMYWSTGPYYFCEENYLDSRDYIKDAFGVNSDEGHHD